MKKFYAYIFILLGLVVFSCEDDKTEIDTEEEILVPVKAEFEARSFDGEAKQVFGIGERITFLDISEGKPDQRTWTLTGAVEQQGEGQVVAAYYNKVGTYPVKLNVTRSSDGDNDAIEVADYITIEHTDVEAVIRADIQEENGMLDVVVGSIVTFEDISSGLPDDVNREWTIEGGTIIEDNGRTIVVQFLEGGVFSIGLKVGRNSDPNSEASFDELLKENYIQVIAPDPYFVTGQGEMLAMDELRLPMVREGLPLEDNAKDAFTVSIVNGSLAKDVAVTSIEEVTEDGKVYLKLKLAEATYNSDMISIAYNSEVSAIFAQDGGEYGGNLKSFTGHEVVPYINDDLCEFLNNTPNMARFDIGGGNADVQGYWAAGGSGLWKRNTSNTYEGAGSMKYSGPLDSRILWDFTLTDNGDIPTGQYLMALRVFIPEGNDMKGLYCYAENKPWGTGLSLEHTWNFENIVRGKWQTVYTHANVKITMLKDPQCRWKWQLRSSDNPGVTGNVEFYIDELRLIPLQTR